MKNSQTLRRDAQNNVEKLRSAALDIFLAKGLGAPLEEIALAAGVSTGTLYNRFGSREALIDAVIPEVVASKIQALTALVLNKKTSRERLETFVQGMIDLQMDDPALNDAILIRFPDASKLRGVCESLNTLGKDLLRDAHEAGILSQDFTEDDLLNLFWLAGVANRDPNPPIGWKRILLQSLTSAWIT